MLCLCLCRIHMAGDHGALTCSHLQSYDPDRALTDYISRLEALQRRLGSVTSGNTHWALNYNHTVRKSIDQRVVVNYLSFSPQVLLHMLNCTLAWEDRRCQVTLAWRNSVAFCRAERSAVFLSFWCGLYLSMWTKTHFYISVRHVMYSGFLSPALEKQLCL